eukprot:1154011-Pelagomonas_calceolata.AAC.1
MAELCSMTPPWLKMNNGDYVANPNFPFFPSGTPQAFIDLTIRLARVARNDASTSNDAHALEIPNYVLVLCLCFCTAQMLGPGPASKAKVR